MNRACRSSAAASLLFAAVVLAACASTPRATPTPAHVRASAVTVTPSSAPTTSTASAGPQSGEADPPDAAAGTSSVTIAAVGDLMLARDIATLMANEGASYPFERVIPMFDDADLLIGNLEGTFTDRGERRDKQYTFRTPPALAEGLALAGFDAVSLANNHSLDFGAVGLLDTVDALEAVGVTPFGAGADEATAYAPAMFEINGQSVAILGFDAIGGTSVARADRAGVAWADEDALASVRAAAQVADHVVVMVHAGIEYSAQPSPEQSEFARSVIDAGADVVIGHHPHALQPWESYGGGLILNSLGNFVFDLDRGDLETLGATPFESAIALVTLSAEAAPQVALRPVMIDVDENRPRPATVEELPAIAARIGEHWPSQVFGAGSTAGAVGSLTPSTETPVVPATAESPSTFESGAPVAAIRERGPAHLFFRDPRSASLSAVRWGGGRNVVEFPVASIDDPGWDGPRAVRRDLDAGSRRDYWGVGARGTESGILQIQHHMGEQA